MNKLNGKLKTFLTDKPLGKFIRSTVIGGVKGIPFVGNIASELLANKADKVTGEGKTDTTRLVIYVLMGVLSLGRIIFPEHINSEVIREIVNIVSELI